jgi:NAD-dependent deacetylase
LAPFAAPADCGKISASRTWRRPRPSPAIPSASTSSTISAAAGTKQRVRTRRISLALLEREHRGTVLTVTQNIDALHEAADTSNLIHMHGELERALCAACGTSVPWTEDLSIETLCARCGEAAMRPDVVWFGEMPRDMERIYEALAACDLFVSIGTSGTVYPAAGFVMEARAAGAHTVELNLEASDGASLFAERIEGPATEIVPAFVDRLLVRQC